MPVDDRTRLNLHRKLEAVLGSEEANTLMAHLPPVTWNEVATKADVRGEVTVLRAEMRTGFAELRTELRTEMTTLGTDLRSEMATLGADRRSEMSALRIDMADGFTRQTRWMVTFAATWSTVLVAAVRFIP